MPLRIRTERDALEYLSNCWHDADFGKDTPLAFETCMLRIRLDPGDGHADWKTVRAIKLLQHHLNLTYLLAKRGTPSGRLSEFDQERLSVAFKVEPGSTTVTIDIAKALNAIYQVLPAHWPTRSRNIVVAGAMLATVAYPSGNLYSTYRTEIDKAQIAAATTLQVAEQSNRTNLEIAKVHAAAQVSAARIVNGSVSPELTSMPPLPATAPMILASLARDDSSKVVAFAVSDHVPWRPALMALAPYAGTIQWNDSRPVPARAAKAIAKAVRAEATVQRRIAKQDGRPGLIETPWVTEVLRTDRAPGAMRLGMSDA
jgi:hypothetical protein